MQFAGNALFGVPVTSRYTCAETAVESEALSRSPNPLTAHRFQADVVDPHLADLGFTNDLELKGQGCRFRLGLNNPFDLRPAPDCLQALFETRRC